MDKTIPDLLTVREAAELLNCTPSRVRQLIRNGQIKTVRSRPYLITREEIETFDALPPGKPYHPRSTKL